MYYYRDDTHYTQTLSLKFCRGVKTSSPSDLQESCEESDCLQTILAITPLEYVRQVVNRLDQTSLLGEHVRAITLTLLKRQRLYN